MKKDGWVGKVVIPSGQEI